MPRTFHNLAVMVHAEKGEILDVGSATRQPGLDMVHFAPMCRNFTPVDHTMLIAQGDEVAQPPGNDPMGPSESEWTNGCC